LCHSYALDLVLHVMTFLIRYPSLKWVTLFEAMNNINLIYTDIAINSFIQPLCPVEQGIDLMEKCIYILGKKCCLISNHAILSLHGFFYFQLHPYPLHCHLNNCLLYKETLLHLHTFSLNIYHPWHTCIRSCTHTQLHPRNTMLFFCRSSLICMAHDLYYEIQFCSENKLTYLLKQYMMLQLAGARQSMKYKTVLSSS
jgi:hypothetical protein